MRALITGISGFVGSHLADGLKARGAEVFGIARTPAAGVFAGNILDEASLHEAIAQSKPTHVFHCAGVLGDKDSELLHETNVTGTSNLFAALSAAQIQPVVVISGSSAVYGRTSSAITEDQPYGPSNVYGESKVEQEEVALAHFRSTGWPVIRVRAFNLIGPRLSTSLAPGNLAKKVVEAERTGSHTIQAKNLDSRRDYTDVRDAVRAYAMLAERGTAGQIYNVCSGVTRSVREILDRLIALTGKKLAIQELVNGSDVSEQVGSYERLRALTGWRPTFDFETSVIDLLNYWRSKNGEGTPR
jgi:GDP-4-dehydro-6-deoxy-D-mannose reductase